jgi:hypothetical protein
MKLTTRYLIPLSITEDPGGWCYRAAQLFEYYNASDPQRFIIYAFHMEGKALVSFQELRTTKGFST